MRLLGYFFTNQMNELIAKWINVHYTGQKFLNSKICSVSFKEVSSAHQACIYLIQNKAKAVIKWKNNCFLFEYI